MDDGVKTLFIAVLIVALAGFFAWIFYKSIIIPEQTPKFNASQNLTNERQVVLYFYDNKTGCRLNGKISVNNELIGETIEGKFILNESTYKSKFKEKSNLSIHGLFDECFNEDEEIVFFQSWIVSSLWYYFTNKENILLTVDLTPRKPRNPIEIMSFVRPYEAELYLTNISLKYKFENNTIEDFTKINKYMTRILYSADSELYNKEEYWATPSETLSKERGDCEDWSLAFLSLIKAYNPKIKCYGLGSSIHLTVFCYLENGEFAFYDQRKIELKTKVYKSESEQEKRIKIRSLINSFFQHFEIPADERKIKMIFSDKEFIEFKENEEFVEWALSLID
ncbi:MAG: hypothetical protein QXF25_01395 [Candidatus Pacearchaeota archaeon]